MNVTFAILFTPSLCNTINDNNYLPKSKKVTKGFHNLQNLQIQFYKLTDLGSKNFFVYSGLSTKGL